MALRRDDCFEGIAWPIIGIWLLRRFPIESVDLNIAYFMHEEG